MKFNTFIIISSLFSSIFFFLGSYSIELGLCADTAYECRAVYNDLAKISTFFFLILFFSTLTYFLPKLVFTTWWKFASVSIPVVFILLSVVHLGLLQTDNYGSFGLGSLFNNMTEQLFTYLLLTIFSIGSLIQIYRGYRNK